MPKIKQEIPVNLARPFTTADGNTHDVSYGLISYYRPSSVFTRVLSDVTGRGNSLYMTPDQIGPSIDLDSPELSGVASAAARSLMFVADSSDLTVNKIESNAELVDHVMGDGLQDTPFSFSAWIKVDSLASTNVIIEKFAVGKREWELFVTFDGKIHFRLGSGTNTADYKGVRTSLSQVSVGNWYHVVVTYDGVIANAATTSFKIFVNNSLKAIVNDSGGSYAGTTSSGGLTRIGAHVTLPSSTDLVGKIYTVGVWRRKLTIADVSAVYSATHTGLMLEADSGFISMSPRILIRELDDHQGSYPTVKRTGDQNRMGNLTSGFDDMTSIVFSDVGSPVFPSMLPNGSSFNTQAVNILGEESNISITAPIRSHQHPTFLHYSPSEPTGPFNENRVMPAAESYLSGTGQDIMPGFSSPTRSKIAIDIDITPQSEAVLMRNVDRRTLDETGVSIGDKSGFMYYNFDRREWEQIGLSDPANGDQVYFDYAIKSTSLSASFPAQFSISPGLPGYTVDTRTAGYEKIGSPTAAFGAPNKTIYHATSSQTLKMSSFIQAPMLLESVTVHFEEVTAQRKQGDSPNYIPASKGGASRDIDNYVFFAYRQQRQDRQRDSVADISGSLRHLVFSGSMSFWNSASFYNDSEAGAVLLHSPAFEHNFGLPYANGYALGQFTGSVDMHLTPAVVGRQSNGLGSYVSAASTPGFIWTRSFWPGGTNPKLNGDAWLLSSGFADAFGWSPSPSFETFPPGHDSRAFRVFGGESAPASNIPTTPYFSSVEQSSVSPYLLLPEDEIVFGLDAGISQFVGSTTFSTITGSQLKISPKACRITLHGSLIRNNAEHLPSLNQGLTSNSIHEIVGAEPVLDQFQIEPISSYFGSTFDNIVTGSMAVPDSTGMSFTIPTPDQSRRVISRVSLGQAGTTGSLQRFSKLSDSAERTYDSCLPSPRKMLPSANVSVSPYRYINDNVLVFSETDWNFESKLAGSTIKQFPFSGDPERNRNSGVAVGILASEDDAGGSAYVASSPTDITGDVLNDLNLIYKTRYQYFSNSPYADLYDIRYGFFLLDNPTPVSLIANCVSYYREPKINLPPYDTTLEDQINGNDLTKVPTDEDTVTHAAPTHINGSPLFPGPAPGTPERGGVLRFPAAAVSSDVTYAEAALDYADHKMTVLGADIPFTVSCVFKLSQTGGDNQFLVERRSKTNLEFSLYVRGTDNKLVFKKGRGSSTTNCLQLVGSTALVFDTWYCATITYDGTDSTSGSHLQLYINGSYIVSSITEVGSAADMAPTTAARLRIGTGMKVSSSNLIPDESTELRSGFIHTVAIWKNRVLDSTDILNFYQAELVGTVFGYVRHRAGPGSTPIGKAPAYRYGISCIQPEFSKTLWNSRQFGQFRNMLEQRPCTATTFVAPPINIRFMSGSAIVNDPNNTHSQNLSTFATSSMPWIDDGGFLNREDNPDETLLIV